MFSLSTTPIPHEAGRDLIRAKAPVTRGVFDRLLPELQSQAFMITGTESANVLQRVRDLTAELPVGGDFDDLKGRILGELSPWLVTDPDPEEAAKQFREAVRRAELLLRMHGWQAYAQTQHEEIMEQIDVFPFCEYLDSDDNRVRATHAALDGKIFPTDHVIWHNHTPPWEFGCRCDKVPRMAEEIDEIRAKEAGKPIEDRQVIEGPMLDEVERGNLVMPGGTGKLDIRTPREKKGSGYEWRPNDRGLDIDTILDRYDTTVRDDFTTWAQGEKLEDGRTVWESFGGKSSITHPPIINRPGKKKVVPAPAVLPPPASLPPAALPRTSPVSAALTIRPAKAAPLKHVLDIIDGLHDDGALPAIPIVGKVSPKNHGHYCHQTMTGVAVEIGVKASGAHPGLTLAHEIGHFLDHHGMGAPGVFQSTIPGSRVAAVIALLRVTPTWNRIQQEAGGISAIAYYESAKETWARAYAQYVAEESGDPLLISQLDGIRFGFADWRQWPAEEFAPIREAIRQLFADLGWNPKQPLNP